MSRTSAAIGAAALLAAVAAFQTALALGAPFGDAVLGGRAPTDDGVLPTRYRVAAALQALVLLGMGTVLLARAGVVRAPRRANRFLALAVWAVAVLMALNTVGNLASDHPFERWVMGAVTAVVAVLAVLVARGSRSR